MDHKFNYMFLGRLQMDIEYFLNYGNRNEKHLYYQNAKEHIKETIALWKKLPVKPEWLRASQLIEYKKQLLKK